MRGFGNKQDSKGREIDLDKVDAQLATPAPNECESIGGSTGMAMVPPAFVQDVVRGGRGARAHRPGSMDAEGRSRRRDRAFHRDSRSKPCLLLQARDADGIPLENRWPAADDRLMCALQPEPRPPCQVTEASKII